MKMYIILKDNIPNNLIPVICAHSSLACYLKYKDDNDMQQWINGIFKKVICIANEKEFEQCKNIDKHLIITESNLDNIEVAIVLVPRNEFPKNIKFLRLYK